MQDQNIFFPTPTSPSNCSPKIPKFSHNSCKGTENDGMTYVVLSQEPSEAMTVQEMRAKLEQGDENSRILAMRQLITSISLGDDCSSLLMSVIRFILPQNNNKTLKKLMLLYFELVPKTDSEGKLKQEMILVCNALRNDLQHPNEYVRGGTLRFLCKIQEQDILAPLIPSVRQCLEHKNYYVRQFALSALTHIYRIHEHLVPDAPALLSSAFNRESDPLCKKAAFISLIEIDLDAARGLFRVCSNDLTSLDPELQLAMLEFMRKDCKVNYNDKGVYVKSVSVLLDSKASAVRFSAANLLILIAGTPNAVKVAVGCFVELAAKETDLNAKLILLGKIKSIVEENPGVCSELALDILKVLATNEIQVKKQCVSLVLSLVSSKHLEEVVLFLRKDLLKFCKSFHEKEGIDDYIDFLLDSLNFCLRSNAEFITKILSVFIELLMQRDAFEGIQLNDSIFLKAILVLRDVLLKETSGKDQILEGIRLVIPHLQPVTFKEAVWILGEFSNSSEQIELAFELIKSLLGELPLIAAESKYSNILSHDQTLSSKESNGTSSGQSSPAKSHQPKVLPDGSYATETVYSAAQPSAPTSRISKRPLVRQFLMDGHYQVAVSISNALVKFNSKLTDGNERMKAELSLMLISMARFGVSSFPSSKIDPESYDRILFDIELICSKHGNRLVQKCLTSKSSDLSSCPKPKLESIIQSKEFIQNLTKLSNSKDASVEKVHFRFFDPLRKASRVCLEDEIEKSLREAIGSERKSTALEKSNLSKVTQFTGYSDSVYAEAYVTVSQFDIFMDVLLVNQTDQIVRNLSFELVTLGDLKLSHKPKPINLAPYAYQTIKTSLRVSSTENAVIFGNIVYDKQGTADGVVISLSDIKIDVVDYIQPASCSQADFNKMYLKFEWENKISLRASAHSLYDYLKVLLEKTHFHCVSPSIETFDDPKCPYLSACLYAKSIFGEEVVANVSLEMDHSGQCITGHLRLRAKSTGIAYSLGELVSQLKNISLL